ncbi:MAG: Cys-tRNA(Pro) deacylase [Bacilli bacterium]|nr:Cys-tRNA(Pro) deacylase [Bacilli bacterium]
MNKTNVMRLLDVGNVRYEPHEYDENIVNGEQVALAVGEDPNAVFKTLVCYNEKKEHYVFCVPVNGSLDLKKAAKVSHSKFIDLIPQKELLPLTGYIHGGCSPIGMKKQFITFIDETAQLFDTIYISGGKRGLQVEINPLELSEYVKATFVDLLI